MDPFARLVDEVRRDPDNAYNLDRFEGLRKPRHPCDVCGALIGGRRRYCGRPCSDLAGAMRRFFLDRRVDGLR